MWLQGGERVIGHLGPGPGEAGQKGALAGVGKTHQPHVGQDLQLQLQLPLLARLAVGGLAGGLVPGRLEVGIAEAPGAAPGRHERLPRLNQVYQHLVGPGVLHHRAGRYPDNNALPVGAVLVAARTVAAPPGLIYAVVVDVLEGGQLGVHLEDHVSPTPPVAARRPAFGDILLPAECDDPVAAVAGFDDDPGIVDEHGLAQSSIR